VTASNVIEAGLDAPTIVDRDTLIVPVSLSEDLTDMKSASFAMCSLSANAFNSLLACILGF
ncbi:MAG: hypothetical protein IKH37_10505, partial [Prevotella sp.]|nr:hypothetical protein [Prevotella sp.]